MAARHFLERNNRTLEAAAMRAYRMLSGAGILLLVVITLWGSFPAETANGAPSVFRKGLVVNKSDKAYAGYTIFCVQGKGVDRVFALNMDGRVIHKWEIPGIGYHIEPCDKGRILILFHDRSFYADVLREYDWQGKITWKFRLPESFNKFHHDFQQLPNGNKLVLLSQNRNIPGTIPYEIEDDVILEINGTGQILWQWSTLEHYDQLGLSDEAKSIIASSPEITEVFHTNSIQSLPQNRHADNDDRFKPGNVLVSQRNTNIVFVIDRATGNIVWHMEATIGQHHASMVPPDLAGAGNILLFDNGGWAGYPTVKRTFSRVWEIDPIAKKAVWRYSAKSNNNLPETFFSMYRGSVQRLPNGNTLIVESAFGRIFEVTAEGEIVWEYINPHFRVDKNQTYSNQIYRAYRVDYTWPKGPTGPGDIPFVW
jgi:outer membrane protein assembly factor BamB